MLNKNSLGVKSARPIRSNPTYVRPKALISAEAKKSPIKDLELSLGHFHNNFDTKKVAK